MDRESWHTTGKIDYTEKYYSDATPYSPELNPMEQVWQQLREIKLSNTKFEDYDHIVASCCKA
jgi:transposase